MDVYQVSATIGHSVRGHCLIVGRHASRVNAASL